MKNRTISAAAVAALLLGSPASAQKVVVDSDPAAAFASYRTYSWIVGTPAANPLAEQRIHALVDEQLMAKGFSKTTAGPDVAIATHVVTKEEKQLNVSDFGGFGWGYGYGFGGTRTATVEAYTVGTLAVDIYDTKTKKLVWRGTGTDTLSSKPDKNTGKADKALDKMFKQYPPTASK